MINWIKYDPENPPIRGDYVITDGVYVSLAAWLEGTFHEYVGIDLIDSIVTHYAHINLPGEDKADD
jgi:hypothetical protein